jgi:hypothetical protein
MKKQNSNENVFFTAQYPLEGITDLSMLDRPTGISSIPLSVIVGNLTLNADKEIAAWHSITLTGNIETNGYKLTLIAGSKVDIDPSLLSPLSPNVDIKIELPPGCNSKLQPVTYQDIATFCKSTRYNPMLPKTLMEAVKANTRETILQATPNPFSQQVNLKYELQQDDEVELVLYNMLGQVVKVIQSQTTVVKGTHELTVTTNDLQNGIYLLSLKTKNGIKTQKVLKTN